jgi:hypothetical protein
MELRTDDVAFTADVDETGQVVSPHTGRALEEREIVVETDDEALHDVLSKLSRGRIIDEIGSNDAPSWTVVDGSHSSRSVNHGPYTYTHRITLRLFEDLRVSALRIGTFRVVPYSYNEETDSDGVMSIRARFALTGDDIETFSRLLYEDGSHQVVREGLDERPREMNFSNGCVWSKHGDEVRHSVDLYDALRDNRRKPIRLFEPQQTNVQMRLIRSELILESLIDALGRKGVLSPDEVTAVRDLSSEDRNRMAFHRLSRVADVDAWAEGDD